MYNNMQGCRFGLWHVGMWLAVAGFAAPAVAATVPPPQVDSSAITLRDGAGERIALNDDNADNADNAGTAHRALAADWPKADDSVLDAARGGFTNGNGLMVSLGVDRLVSINGDVVAHSRIEIADLGRIDSGQARQTSDALSSVKLVQIGGENIYRAGEMGAALGGVIVQNSLDNQLIRTDTIIHSTVNSAGLLNAINFHGTLHDALARAVGQP